MGAHSTLENARRCHNRDLHPVVEKRSQARWDASKVTRSETTAWGSPTGTGRIDGETSEF